MAESDDPQDLRLLEILDADMRVAAEHAGAWLRCAPGCDSCCRRAFPITRLDARRLRLGLESLGRVDPSRARRVIDRSHRAAERLSEKFPGSTSSGKLRAGERQLDAYFERHEGLACPALDPRSGRCDLYDWRPVACRTYGPPLRFGPIDSPPCELCFRGADDETIERCRVEPDRDGLEQSLLDGLNVSPGREWDTLVAFAIRDA